jgi:glycosyltransferase involved in cell wall biosynthesis
LITEIIKSDIIWFQKITHPFIFFCSIFSRLIGKIVVFDFDDPLFLINWFQRMAINCMIISANLVTTDSHPNQTYARKLNKRSIWIPDTIPLDMYHHAMKRKQQDITIGWVGHGLSYARDLKLLASVIEKVPARYKNKIRLRIIGSMGSQEILSTFNSIKNAKVEIINELDWSNPSEVSEAISSFDIGVMLLEDTEYNSYKGCFKVFEYWALGKPVVASAVGEAKIVIKEGFNGFVAKNEKEWVTYLSMLIENDDLRKKMGENGRKTVEKYFSLEACERRLLQMLPLKSCPSQYW